MLTFSCLLLVGAAHAIQLGAAPGSSRGAQSSAPASTDVSKVPISLDVLSDIQRTIAGQQAVVFSKSGDTASLECKGIFDSLQQQYTAVELDQRADGEAMEAALLSLTHRPMPNVFVGGQFLGGNAEMVEAAATGLLSELLEETVAPPRGCVVPTGRRSPTTK